MEKTDRFEGKIRNRRGTARRREKVGKIRKRKREEKFNLNLPLNPRKYGKSVIYQKTQLSSAAGSKV